MNRIYQGRVIKVEPLNDGQPEPLPKREWQKASWQRHKFFRNAVNYHPLASAAY
jgi:hypothetical protein